MVSLREVDITNFDEAINLKRKSTLYVGGPEYVLAEAYVYRGDSTACAIYADDIMVGMVIVRDHPRESCPYSFTDYSLPTIISERDTVRRRWRPSCTGSGKNVSAIMLRYRFTAKMNRR